MTIEEVTLTGVSETLHAAFTKYNATVDDLTGDNTMSIHRHAGALADDATESLPDATYGQIIATCGDEWLIANVQADGTINLFIYSDEVDDANTDGKFCLYASGTQGIIKNRLGSTKNVTVNYLYFEP